MSWGPVVGGLGGLARLVDTGGGVERDVGVCMPLSLGEAEEAEADDVSLFADDERVRVTCFSSFGVSWGTGETDLVMNLSSTGVPWSDFSVRWVSSGGIGCVGRVWLDARASWSPAESE